MTRSLILYVLRWALRVLRQVSPDAAARLAARLFCTPTRMRLRRAQRAFLDRGKLTETPFRNKVIRAFEFGSGPTALLVHGWAGRGAQMISFVDPLVSAGYRVVIVDMPSHGSSTGRTSTLAEFRDAVRFLAHRFAPCELLVTHSFGAAGALLALEQPGLPVQRAVLVASPSGFDHYIEEFLATLDLPASFWPAVLQTIERSVGESWSEFDLLRAASRVTIPVLIVHDLEDVEIKPHHAQALKNALPNAVLMQTRGLGHNRILRDRQVIAEAAAFLTAPDEYSAAASSTGVRRSPLRAL